MAEIRGNNHEDPQASAVQSNDVLRSKTVSGEKALALLLALESVGVENSASGLGLTRFRSWMTSCAVRKSHAACSINQDSIPAIYIKDARVSVLHAALVGIGAEYYFDSEASIATDISCQVVVEPNAIATCDFFIFAPNDLTKSVEIDGNMAALFAKKLSGAEVENSSERLGVEIYQADEIECWLSKEDVLYCSIWNNQSLRTVSENAARGLLDTIEGVGGRYRDESSPKTLVKAAEIQCTVRVTVESPTKCSLKTQGLQ